NPQRYMMTPNVVCRDWKATMGKCGTGTAEWQGLDPSIPATYGNPQQKAVNMAAEPAMVAYANKLQQLRARSQHPIRQHCAELSALYRRAFVLALPACDPSDKYLANAATYVSTTTLGACAAATMTG